MSLLFKFTFPFSPIFKEWRLIFAYNSLEIKKLLLFLYAHVAGGPVCAMAYT